METTTFVGARARRSTSARCPSWRAPIVGTKRDARPARAHGARARSRSVATVVTVFIAVVRSRGVERHEPASAGRPDRPRTTRPRDGKRPVSHVGGVRRDGRAGHDRAERRRSGGRSAGTGAPASQAEQVVEDQDLAVAPGAGADADRRDGHASVIARGELGRDRLEDEGEDAGVVEPRRLVDERGALGGAAPLDLEAAEGVAPTAASGRGGP